MNKKIWFPNERHEEIKINILLDENNSVPYYGFILPKLGENENLIAIPFMFHAEFFILSDEEFQKLKNEEFIKREELEND